MTLSPISRRAGMLSLTAAVLIVLSQVMRLVGGPLLGPDLGDDAGVHRDLHHRLAGNGRTVACTDGP
jgi:hypothetical protein